MWKHKQILSGADKSKVFDKRYFEGKKGSYKKKGYHFESRYTKFIALAKIFHQFGVRKALDIGCATGPLVKAFLDCGIDAYGIDVSEWAVKNSIVSNRLIRLDIDEVNLPFSSNFFDLITMNFVIEHLHSPEDALKEIFRVLKPGGFLYIKTDKPDEDFQNQVGHVNVRSMNSWLHLLKGMTFETSKIRYLHFVMLYLYNDVKFGPLAKRLLLHRLGLAGRVARWIFEIIYYRMGDSAILLVRKPK